MNKSQVGGCDLRLLEAVDCFREDTKSLDRSCSEDHTGQCKRTGGCYNELVVAFFSTGGGVKGKKIHTC